MPLWMRAVQRQGAAPVDAGGHPQGRGEGGAHRERLPLCGEERRRGRQARLRAPDRRGRGHLGGGVVQPGSGSGHQGPAPAQTAAPPAVLLPYPGAHQHPRSRRRGRETQAGCVRVLVMEEGAGWAPSSPNPPPS